MNTQSDKDEFVGLKYLMFFLHKSLKIFEANETRLGDEIELEKALDIFKCISLVNKYLDKAQITCFVK